jgi:serine/threonine-protein kinase SIK3
VSQISLTLQRHGFELREQIGAGGFGCVYAVWHSGYQRTLAIKISRGHDASWSSELENLKAIYHPNIVKLYDNFDDGAFSYLVLEYCSEGTLATRIEASGALSFREFRDIALQLLEALDCCHKAGIAHLDIKPANIFFHEDGRVRLGDFGCSRRRGANFMGGSGPFMSPEIVCQCVGFDKFQSDVWSLGVTFYFMACGALPWKGTTTEEIRAEIRLGAVPQPSKVDHRVARLISSMLVVEPLRRAALQSLIETVSSWEGPVPVIRGMGCATPGLRAPGKATGMRIVSMGRSFSDARILRVPVPSYSENS